MAELGAIVGESGSGKSTSLRNLNPAQTFIINVHGQTLPFKEGIKRKNYKQLTYDAERGYSGNLYNTSNVEQISKALKIIDQTMPHIKQIIR